MRTEVLRDVLAQLDRAPDLATAASVIMTCAPGLADLAGVWLIDGVTRGDDAAALVPGAALWVREPGHPDPAFRPGRALVGGSVLRSAMESQGAVRYPGLTSSSLEVVAADLDQELPAVALAGSELLVVPMICGGLTIGVLVLLRGPQRPSFTVPDVELIEQLATVTALRLDHLRLLSRHAQVVAALGASLLPAIPRGLTAVDVASRYRPAHRGDAVGGDWLDAIELPGGRTAFTIGDVMGHGPDATAVMSLLRSALQAVAPLQLEPAQVLQQLDDLALQHQAARPGRANWLATCLFAVYDPVTSECAIANAGHPLPVLTDPDGRSQLWDLAPGTPIGVGGTLFRTARRVIPNGSQLTFYTDGLVEVRGQDIDDGMNAVCRSTSRGLRLPIEELCQELMDQVRPSSHPDDVAVLVARFPGLAPERASAWTLSAHPDMVRYAGWLTGRILLRWGLAHHLDAVVPLVDELVANAVRHAAGPVTLRLVRGYGLHCEVGDSTGHLPVPRDESILGAPAQGLRLLGGRTRRWGTYRTATGKVVWFDYPLAA